MMRMSSRDAHRLSTPLVGRAWYVPTGGAHGDTKSPKSLPGTVVLEDNGLVYITATLARDSPVGPEKRVFAPVFTTHVSR
jgi:hypothetical protein